MGYGFAVYTFISIEFDLLALFCDRNCLTLFLGNGTV